MLKIAFDPIYFILANEKLVFEMIDNNHILVESIAHAPNPLKGACWYTALAF